MGGSAASVKMILEAGGRAAIWTAMKSLDAIRRPNLAARRFFAADVTDAAGVQRAVDGAVEAFGALHLFQLRRRWRSAKDDR